MSIWKLLRSKKREVRRAPQEVRPSLEQLEPRLLLSADFAGIEPILAPDAPSSEHAIYIDLEEGQADTLKSLPTITVDPDQSLQAEEVIAFSQTEAACSGQEESLAGEAQPVEVTGPLGTDAGMEEAISGSSLGQMTCVAQAECPDCATISQEETAGPVVADQQEVIPTSESPSIEIRGPPQGGSDSLNSESEVLYSDNQQSAILAGCECVSTLEGAVAPVLPGLVLVDPDISNWQGQVIYLDFDGAEDVTYNGPVTIGPFDVPAFQAPGELAGQEQTIIDQVLANLQDIFAGSGVIFTTEQPTGGTKYSTIYIGGDDSPFAQYGEFLGLAERVDVGNEALSDSGFVFSEHFTACRAEMSVLTDCLEDLIVHETAHLVGYEHDEGALAAVRRNPLAPFAAITYIDDDYTSSTPGWGQDHFAKIQDGIDGAIDGHVVIVADGTYHENIDFAGKDIVVRSEGGPSSTIIDGGQIFNVVRFTGGESRATVLDGFTLTNGRAPYHHTGHSGGEQGGGILIDDSSPTIQNCVIGNNQAAIAGGGMMIGNSSAPLIENTVFWYNVAGASSGAVYADGPACAPIFSNCLFVGNDSSGQAGVMQANGGALITVLNSTMSDNAAVSGPAAIFTHGSWEGFAQVQMTDTIVSSNRSSDVIQLQGDIVATYSLIEGSWPGYGNISTDPNFQTGPLGSYYLSLSSPCIDAGSGPASYFYTAGTTRVDHIPDAGTVDMGYHYSCETLSTAVDPDRFEPNETRQTAADLGLVSGRVVDSGLTIHDGSDRDWFRFETAASSTDAYYVEVLFSHSAGDLDARLYSADGSMLHSAATTTDNERLSLAGLGAGTYYIEVFGWDGATSAYDLVIVAPPDVSASGSGFDYGEAFVAALGFAPIDIAFEADPADDTRYIIEGTVSLPSFLGSAQVGIAEGSYVQVSQSGWLADGAVFIEDVTFASVWGIESASVDFLLGPDATETYVRGDAAIRIPGGVTAEGYVEFIDGQLNAVGLGAHELQMPIPSTPVYLQDIGGTLDHLQDPDPVTFGGELGLTAGPEFNIRLFGYEAFSALSLLRVDLEGTVNRDRLEGNGTVTVLGGLVVTDGYAELNWSQGYFESGFSVDVLSGLFTGDMDLYMDTSANFTISGSGAVGIPTFIPLIGGIELASGSGRLEFTNNGLYDDDYIAVWGQVPWWVPYWGGDPVGVQLTFDGDWSPLGAKEIEAIAPVTVLASSALTGFSTRSLSTSVTRGFLIPEGTPHLLLSGEWENAYPDVSIRLTAPDGTVYEDEDFAAAGFIALVPEMTDEQRRTVALDAPAVGEWRVEVVSDGDLGEVSVGVLAGTTTPTVVITDVSHDPEAGTVSLHYAAPGADDGAMVGLFYTSSGDGAAGIRFATLGVPGEGDGVYAWDISGLPPGDYYVYGILEGQGVVPSASVYSDPFTVVPDNEAPLTQDKAFELNEGANYVAALPASDADGDELTFELVDNPVYGEVVVNADGTFAYTAYLQPTAGFVSEDAFTFIANDGLADSNIGTMTVTVSNTNRAPVLASIGDRSVTEGASLSFTVSATDIDGDAIAYSATGLPTGATFSGQTFSWTPGYDQTGPHDITFIASDGEAQDSEVVTVTVSNELDSPEYEAEDAVLNECVVRDTYPGYTGSAFVDFLHSTDDYIEWTVSVSTSGQYELEFCYALSSGDRPLEISVNGQIVEASLSFAATGDWASWGTVSTVVTLDSGDNTIRARAIGFSGANIDHLRVIEQPVYEAEDAVLNGCVVSDVRAGYTGSGFVDFLHSTDDYIEWTVSVDASGLYELEFCYALSSGDRPLEISVNGQVVEASLSFGATGDWASWGTVSTVVTLDSGDNTIRARAIGFSGANIDHLRVI